MHAKGTFEVELKPQEFYAQSVDATKLGRMSIDKHFSGELEANSKGEMLMAMTATEGSAAYVAIEQVEGSLAGKKGAFVLQHFGTREAGNERLILEVVAGSGSGELAGLRGKMEIIIENGAHRYEFEYSL